MIWISKAHWEFILFEANRMLPNETGGILIGYVAKNDYVVTDVVGPGEKAKHSRYKFVPDGDYHQKEIERVFNDSGGENDYLGDWHTHPNGKCQMSWMDCRTLRKIADSEINYKKPLMVIACGKNAGWDISGWSYLKPHWFKGSEPQDLVVKIYS